MNTTLQDNSQQFFQLTQERNQYKRGTVAYVALTQKIKTNKLERKMLKELETVKRKRRISIGNDIMLQSLGNHRREIRNAIADIRATLKSM